MISWEHFWKVLSHMGIKGKKFRVVFELYMMESGNTFVVWIVVFVALIDAHFGTIYVRNIISKETLCFTIQLKLIQGSTLVNFFFSGRFQRQLWSLITASFLLILYLNTQTCLCSWTMKLSMTFAEDPLILRGQLILI